MKTLAADGRRYLTVKNSNHVNFENKHWVIQNLNNDFASCSLKMCGASL